MPTQWHATQPFHIARLHPHMDIQTILQTILTNPQLLAVWGTLVSVCLLILFRDLTHNNAALGTLMKYVWGFTVLYSGPFGLAVYWYTGRTQIKHDSIWRRSFRSVCHCYSGCGTGEIIGVTIAVGVLSLANLWVAALTFACAYTLGFALTVGPLLEDGVPLKTALLDAFYTDTASITVMEIVAISVDLWLAGDAGLTSTLFWTALIFSLSIGLFAAYPVNVLLIKYGVKDGMMNPQQMRDQDSTTHHPH